MLGRNIDFFAVSVIALAMLALAEVRSWHLTEGLDSIHIADAIRHPALPDFPAGLVESLRDPALEFKILNSVATEPRAASTRRVII